MALPQFVNDYKRMLSRYRQAPNKVTFNTFNAMDYMAKRLADKGMAQEARPGELNKLRDAMKKLKLRIKDEINERTKAHQAAIKEPPEDFDLTSATRTLNNVKRELLLLEKKAQRYCDSGGEEAPPPPLPQFHFGADYNRIISKYAGDLSVSVVSALDKADESPDAGKAVESMKLARVEMKKQTTTLAAEVSKTKDPKLKPKIAGMLKDLLALYEQIKQTETRIFLLHRLK